MYGDDYSEWNPDKSTVKQRGLRKKYFPKSQNQKDM